MSGFSLNEGALSLLLSVVYALLYTLVPLGILLPLLGKTTRGRKIVRALTIFSPLFFILAPAMFNLFTAPVYGRRLWHAGNGPLVIAEASNGNLMEEQMFAFVILPLVLVGFLLVLPMCLRALRETTTASSSS